jgi:hypothetical protein
MFGEGGQKERKPSTHSLGILPIGGIDDDQFFIDCRHRRPSAGPFITPVSRTICVVFFKRIVFD